MGSNSQNDQIYRSDLDLMTLVLKLDLDMVKYHHTKNEVSMLRHSKVIACTDTQTDTHTQYENITFPHTRAVKIYNCHTLFLKFTEAKNCIQNILYINQNYTKSIYSFEQVSRFFSHLFLFSVCGQVQNVPNCPCHCYPSQQMFEL